MTEALVLTNLSMDNPSTLLSMDSGITQEEVDFSRSAPLSRPPDINLPLTTDIYPVSWLNDPSDILNVGLAYQLHDPELTAHKAAKRCNKRSDIIWGAWFFFSHYFRPLLLDKSKGKISRDGSSSVSLLEKVDLKDDHFLVQHDMENMYMWVFKERPYNALGKMQLRSYMNGHVKQGEPQFPFSPDKGFLRSHKMQRKHYKGLSNPQCIHGIEIVRCPNFSNVNDEDRNRWVELTGRDLNFSVPKDAEAFTAWRSLPSIDSEFERSAERNYTGKVVHKKPLGRFNGSMLNLSAQPPSLEVTNVRAEKKRRKEASPASSEECSLKGIESPGSRNEQPNWLADFTGVMVNVTGPVTAAKTIYEDEKGYLIMVSLPFTDIQRIRVSWRNTVTHGIVKIHCNSMARMQYIKRGDRTFELTDPTPEHCPPGEFIREISLATRIPENAELKAFYNAAGAGLEIMVPKHQNMFEEREVRVFLPPQLGPHCESLLS